MSILGIFVTFSIFIFFAINYWLHKDFFYPPVVQSLIWFCVLLFHSINENLFGTLSVLTYVIIWSGVLMFSLGGFLAFPYIGSYRKYWTDVYPFQTNFFSWLSLILPILGLPFMIHKAMVMSSGGPFYSVYRNLRYAMTAETGSGGYGVLAYLLPISFAAVGVHLLQALQGRRKRWFWVSLLVAGVYAVLSTGRTAFFLLIIFITCILGSSRSVGALKLVLSFLIFGLLTFFGLAVLTAKGFSSNADFSSNITGLWHTFLVYSIGPLPALDHVVRSVSEFSYGTHSFRTLFAILKKLGMDVHVVPLVRNFIDTPIRINVYTAYSAYFRDFYVYGALFFPLLVGYWHGFLYKKASHGNIFYLLMFSLFFYPLFMQFFQDQYFSLLSTWIQFFIILYASCIVFRWRVKKIIWEHQP